MPTKSVDWWVDRLDGVQKVSDGFTALCPGHDDRKGSLHLTVDSSGEVLVHCFAGCEYSQVLAAIDGRVEALSSKKKTPSLTIVETPRVPASQWWEEYTGIPWIEWEGWGAQSNKTGVEFTWESSRIVKKRLTGQKVFVWEPDGAAAPPLWPEPRGTLPQRIWITEGESDCGVLRHIGLPAFAITKGVGVKRAVRGVWTRLSTLGVSEIVLAFDQDEPGQKGALDVAALASSEGLKVFRLDLQPLLNPLLGEKDLRDLWIRIRDPLELEELLVSHIGALGSQESFVTVDQFLQSRIDPAKWLVDQIWLTNAIGMIVGAPKMGKSWLALDMAISVSTGRPFLGKYEVSESGCVVLLTKEDPDHLLQDRLVKICMSKGLGGTIQDGLITFPGVNGLLYLDLSRSFMFTPPEVESLMSNLEILKAKHGSISLVIFDPILRMMVGVDEYKATEVGSAVFAVASRIQTEIGAGVVLVHHRGKGAQEGKSSYGSIAFHAFSENTLYIQGDTPDDEGWVRVKGEYKSAAETAWAYRFPELSETYQVEISSDIEITTGNTKGAARGILELLREISPDGLTVDQLVEAIEGSTQFMIRESLKQLESQKKIRREKEDPKEGRKGGPRRDSWFVV